MNRVVLLLAIALLSLPLSAQTKTQKKAKSECVTAACWKAKYEAALEERNQYDQIGSECYSALFSSEDKYKVQKEKDDAEYADLVERYNALLQRYRASVVEANAEYEEVVQAYNALVSAHNTMVAGLRAPATSYQPAVRSVPTWQRVLGSMAVGAAYGRAQDEQNAAQRNSGVSCTSMSTNAGTGVWTQTNCR